MCFSDSPKLIGRGYVGCFGSAVTNYYATHSLTRNSGILALAYNRYKRNTNFKS